MDSLIRKLLASSNTTKRTLSNLPKKAFQFELGQLKAAYEAEIESLRSKNSSPDKA
jgi:hypothetical protein